MWEHPHFSKKGRPDIEGVVKEGDEALEKPIIVGMRVTLLQTAELEK